MKNKIGILSGLVMAGVLLLAGCSGVLDDAQTSGGATGTVLVEIGSPADARTLAPPSTGLTFVLGYTTKNSDKDYVYADASASKTLTLEPGVWNLSAIGYQDTAKTKAVAKGETAVTVRAGEAVTASILLSKAGDVNEPGFFAYDVVWTGIASTSKGLTQVELKLSPADAVSVGNAGEVIRDLDEGYQWATGGNPTDSKGETMTAYGATHTTGKIPLPAGVYDLDISVTTTGSTSIDSENTTIHRKEKVYIYSYLTTEAPPYTFTQLDIQKLYLSGDRPILRSGNINYYARTIELYDGPENDQDKELLKFSLSNATNETQSAYTFTSTGVGTWNLYLPGYQVSNSVSVDGTSSIYAKTTWNDGDQDLSDWKEVKITDKQITDTIDLDAVATRITFGKEASATSSVNPLIGIGTGSMGTFTYNSRSALAGQKVHLQMTGSSTERVSFIELLFRVLDADGNQHAVSEYVDIGSTGIIRSGNNYTYDFDMPPAPTDYTFDTAYQNSNGMSVQVQAYVHTIAEGDVILGRHVGETPVVDSFEKRYRISSVTHTTGNNQAFIFVRDEDESKISGDTPYLYTGQERRYTFPDTGSYWRLPTILELGDMAVNVDNKSVGDFDHTPGSGYWSSQRGRYAPGGTTPPEIGYLYRTFDGSNGYRLVSSTLTFYSGNENSDPFDQIYSSMTKGQNAYGFDSITEPSDPLFTARVRLVKDYTWSE